MLLLADKRSHVRGLDMAAAHTGSIRRGVALLQPCASGSIGQPLTTISASRNASTSVGIGERDTCFGPAASGSSSADLVAPSATMLKRTGLGRSAGDVW